MQEARYLSGQEVEQRTEFAKVRPWRRHEGVPPETHGVLQANSSRIMKAASISVSEYSWHCSGAHYRVRGAI